MTFTRTAAFSAAALASALVLASCSGGGDDDQESAEQEDVSIDYWYWQDDTTDTTIQDLAADFEAETGIHVNIQDDIAQPDFYDSLVNAVAAGNAPDATHLNTNMFGQLIDAGVLEDLSDRIEDWDGADAVSENLWPYVESPDGEGTYAVPNKFLMFIMFYRADLFDAAGVEVPTTQEEFVAASNTMVDTAAGRYGFDIRGGANGQDQWAAFLVAGGARFVDEDGEVVFDSPEARESNDLYADTFESAPPGAINDGFAQIIANFQAGTASMIINHLGAADALVEALGQEAVGVSLIPSASGDPADTTYMGTMNANAVLADSEKKDAAFQWISYLAEEKAQLAITESPNGYLPVVSSVAEDPQFADDPYFQTSIEASQQAGTVAWPSIPGTTVATQQTWQPLFQGALLGDNSNDDVITGVADALSGDG